MQLVLSNEIPIPLCITLLIYSFIPDIKGRYIGFCYFDWKTINQLDTCQVVENEVFHVQVTIVDDKTDLFIQNSPSPHTWEITYS